MRSMFIHIFPEHTPNSQSVGLLRHLQTVLILLAKSVKGWRSGSAQLKIKMELTGSHREELPNHLNVSNT